MILKNLTTIRHCFYWCLAGSLFLLTRPLRPLYAFDQNAYFAQGLAKAGIGSLANDTFATSPATYPLFSKIVEWTVSFGHESLFYIYFFIFATLYLYSLVEITAHIFKIKQWSTPYWALTLSLICLHSNPLQIILESIGSWILPRQFFYGIAQQYLIHYEWIPSSWGVLLLFSILLFLKNKPLWATTALWIGASVHVAMILPATLLNFGMFLYLVIYKKERALTINFIALSALLCSPIVLYEYLYISDPTVTTASKALAYTILITIKTPTTLDPSHWQIGNILIKGILCSSIMVLFRHNKVLQLVFTVPLLSAIALTSIYAITKWPFLALLSPWRLSVVLVPIATSLLLGKILKSRLTQYTQPILILLISSTVILGIIGSYKTWQYFTYFKNPTLVDQAFVYIRNNQQPSDHYLIHPALHYVRLLTKAPIFVDYGSITRGADAHIEWNTRRELANIIYTPGPLSHRKATLQKIINTYHITHFVTTTNDPLIQAINATLCYKNSYAGVYKLPQATQ